MKRNRATRWASLTWVVVAGLMVGPRVAADTPRPKLADLLDELPLAKRTYRTSELAKAGRAELLGLVDRNLKRLMVDPQEAVIRTPADVADVVVTALAALLADLKPGASRAAREALARVGYLVHLTGARVRHDHTLRAALARQQASARGTKQKAAHRALVRSARALQEVGRWLFPNALHRVGGAGSAGIWHTLRGRFLLREGRWNAAAKAFGQALEKDRSVAAALNLFRALIAGGKVKDARRVAGHILRAAPGKASRLEAWVARRADEKTVARLSALTRRGVTQELDLFGRHARLKNYGAASAILAGLLKRVDTHPAIAHRAAEYLYARRALGELAALLDRVKRKGDRRLLEARIALHATQVMNAYRKGRTSSPSLPLLERALRAYMRGASDDTALVVRAIRLFIVLAKPKPTRADGATLARLVREGLQKHPRSYTMLELATGAILAAKGSREVLRLVASRIPVLGTRAGARAEHLLARLEVGYGIRERKRGLLHRAARRAKRLAGQADWGWQAGLTARFARFTATLFKSGAADKAQAKALLAYVVGVIDRFDDYTPRAKRHLAAHLLTAGSLAWWTGKRGLAHRALLRAFDAGYDTALGQLSGGILAMMHRDPALARDRLRRGLVDATRPSSRFSLLKWLALAEGALGGRKARRKALAALDVIWKRARAVRKKADVPVPLFLGAFHVALTLAPGAPLGIDVRLDPVSVIVMDFAHDRERVRAALR